MKKLHLSIELLRVESFETEETPDTRGTVRGREGETEFGTYCDNACSGTCFYCNSLSCAVSCEFDCQTRETCLQQGGCEQQTPYAPCET